MFSSVGILRYSIEPTVGYKLIVAVDPEIVRLARALVPKCLRLNPQRYEPHISVVRKEVPPRLENWGHLEGQSVPFCYRMDVYNDETYYWIQAFSDRLNEIRVELGLPPTSELSRPPDAADCFHVTIGNRKA